MLSLSSGFSTLSSGWSPQLELVENNLMFDWCWFADLPCMNEAGAVTVITD